VERECLEYHTSSTIASQLHITEFSTLKGNPQTTRVLANEYLAGHLARTIGLSVPEPVIIHVDLETIDECKIEFQLAGTHVAPTAGRQFGSRLIVEEEVHDGPKNRAATRDPN